MFFRLNTYLYNMKRCSKCKLEKPLNEYHNCKSCKYGVKNQCKICAIETEKLYKLRHKEKIKEQQNLYRQTEGYKEKKKIYDKEYRRKNKEKAKAYAKKWLIENRDKKNKYNVIHHKKHPHFKICRRLLMSVLNRVGGVKEKSTHEILKYSSLELREHLESLFTEGMTWDNYGEWHVDHIKPVSSFDKDTPMDVINNLTNLQPLWATTREINGIFYEGNLNKGSKLL
jgi:hypothetical protein